MRETRKNSTADESRNTSRDTSEAEKQKLINQISEIRSLISHIKENSDIVKFGDVDKTGISLLTQTLNYRISKKTPNTNKLMQRELQKFMGFYCAKFDKNEYIFNYRPHDKILPNTIFSVQIHNRDGIAAVGKWVMPVAIDINDVLEEAPIGNISAVIPFLKNWKLYIDCYTERKLQFYELKDLISDSSNCTIEANPSITLITLRMFGVHKKVEDYYVDLDVYLSYKKNETIACNIKTEWSEKTCSDSEKNELKAYTKSLKIHRLLEAFRLMIDPVNPFFIWKPENHDDSPLELNDTSDSDEETILGKVQLDRKNAKRRKRRLSKGKKKRKSAIEEMEIIPPSVQVSKEKSLKLPLQTRKPVETSTKRQFRQATINFSSKKTSEDNSTTETVEMNKKGTGNTVKLKLFDDTESWKKTPPAMKKPSIVGILSAKKKGVKKNNRAITSTPLNKKKVNKVKFVPMRDVDLSPIVKNFSKKTKK